MVEIHSNKAQVEAKCFKACQEHPLSTFTAHSFYVLIDLFYCGQFKAGEQEHSQCIVEVVFSYCHSALFWCSKMPCSGLDTTATRPKVKKARLLTIGRDMPEGKATLRPLPDFRDAISGRLSSRFEDMLPVHVSPFTAHKKAIQQRFVLQHFESCAVWAVLYYNYSSMMYKHWPLICQHRVW